MTTTGSGRSKCLLLGGYLILDHNSTGIVVSLAPQVRSECACGRGDSFSIHVSTSPQQKEFDFDAEDFRDPGTFVGKYERFLLAAFHVLFSCFPVPASSLCVAVFGDSEFYGSSNGKTGLGSSSAMTVAVIESVAKFLAEGDLPKVQIFKMAAIAHSLAQGNIGSCFDVSCAVWGSQRFRRPNPCFLELGRINEDWDNEFVPFSLPGHLRICVLRTPFLGSSTPGLVKRFLENAEREKKLVNDLKDAVEPASLALLSGDFAAIRDKFRRVRRVLRQITEQWRLEIVPDEVNELADHLEEVEGVIAAVIPGAGGYDSLAVIAQQGSELDFGNLSVEILAQTDESSENP